MNNKDGRSPAQLFALVVGAVLVLAGILGFFYNAEFSTGEAASRDAVLGILDVNAIHNIVHIASGLLLLSVVGNGKAARTVVLAFSVIYLLVTILGFIEGDGGTILNLVPVNTEDNILHLLLTLAGFGAYAASSPEKDDAGARARTA